MGAYLGLDLHRRRSLAVCLNEAGDRLWWRRFENSPENLAGIIEEAGPWVGGGDRSYVGLVLGG